MRKPAYQVQKGIHIMKQFIVIALAFGMIACSKDNDHKPSKGVGTRNEDLKPVLKASDCQGGAPATNLIGSWQAPLRSQNTEVSHC